MKRNTQKKETILRVNEPATLMAFLLAKMGGMTRTSVKSLLAHRQVELNGKIETRFDAELQIGDTINICKARANAELSHPKLRMVYEDEHLVVVEKRVGLLTVATRPGSAETTCMSILKQYLRKANPRAGIYVVHRLDRETSGLLVFAKTPELQEYMRTYWQQLVSRRTYVALAEGIFEEKEGKITTWLTEDNRSAHVYSSPTDNGGKIAITNYKVIKESMLDARGSMLEPQVSSIKHRASNLETYSLVELNLETGRTNQIRVHLESLGHPVVGDRKYGSGKESPIDRLALHARVLEFIHPVTEKKVCFETPIPKEFQRLL